jgi:hypothetical protein
MIDSINPPAPSPRQDAGREHGHGQEPARVLRGQS